MTAEARHEPPPGGDGGNPAVDELVSENLGLVYDLARKMSRFGGNGPERDDLVSAGVQGLIQAAHAFDPGRGLAFSTLAVTRIRGAMLDELRRWDQTPRSVRKKERELKATEASLRASLGRRPTPDELAYALGIEVEELHDWYLDMTVHEPESLDRGVGGRDEPGRRTTAETVPDPGQGAFEALGQAQSVEVLAECIQDLSERDRQVLALYYYEDLRLREIAQLIGVTESRISQIRHAALKTLRGMLSERGVEP